jgi:hypothetical protein
MDQCNVNGLPPPDTARPLESLKMGWQALESALGAQVPWHLARGYYACTGSAASGTSGLVGSIFNQSDEEINRAIAIGTSGRS